MQHHQQAYEGRWQLFLNLQCDSQVYEKVNQENHPIITKNGTSLV